MPGFSIRRVDNNHKQIVNALRMVPGLTVHDTHALPRFADIVVGWNNRNFIFEIKTDHKKKLTPDEKILFDTWEGQIDIITSAEEALKIIFNPIN